MPIKALAVLLACAAATPAFAGPYPEQKVVYHNSGTTPEDPGYFKRMLSNVRNHIAAVGEDNIEVVVVGHGGGVDLLEQANDDAELAGRIDALRAQGVRFLVCANTLNARHISASDLYGTQEADIVPSGVAEIAKLEQEGFVYLHP
jgi:intracellular sulfur oxidation DsrE/DsrF family protein